MKNRLSITVEPEFSMQEGGSKLFDKCIRYAEELDWALGGGVSLRFSKGERGPLMASFHFQGAQMGVISFAKGRLVIPFNQKTGWDARLIHASPKNVWDHLFLPRINEIMKRKRLRFEELEQRVVIQNDHSFSYRTGH